MTESSSSGRKRPAPPDSPTISKKVLKEDQFFIICDFEEEEDQDSFNDSEPSFTGSSSLFHQYGEERSFTKSFEEMMRDKVQKILEGLEADTEQDLLANINMWSLNIKYSLQTTNENRYNDWIIQQEQRQNLHHRYLQQFLNLFREWNAHAEQVKKEEIKLAIMLEAQRINLQQALYAQNETMEKINYVYNNLLKNLEHLDKYQEHYFTDEHGEVRQENDNLLENIVVQAQQQRLETTQEFS